MGPANVRLVQLRDGSLYLVLHDPADPSDPSNLGNLNDVSDSGAPGGGGCGSTYPMRPYPPAWDRSLSRRRWAIGSLRYFGAWVVGGLVGLPLLALVVSVSMTHGRAVWDERTLTWPIMLLTIMGALIGGLLAVALEAGARWVVRRQHQGPLHCPPAPPTGLLTGLLTGLGSQKGVPRDGAPPGDPRGRGERVILRSPDSSPDSSPGLLHG